MTENRVKLIVGDESLNKLYFELTAYTCSRVLVVSDNDKNSLLIKKTLLKTTKNTDLDLRFESFDEITDIAKCAEDIARTAKKFGCNAILVAGEKLVIDATKIASALLSLGVENVSDIGSKQKKGTSYPLFVASVGIGYDTSISSSVVADNNSILNELLMKIAPDVLFVDKRLCYIENYQKCLLRRNYVLARVLTILPEIDDINEPNILAILNILKLIEEPKYGLPVGNTDNAYYLSQVSAIMCFVKERNNAYFDIIKALCDEFGYEMSEVYPLFVTDLLEVLGINKRMERLSRLFNAIQPRKGYNQSVMKFFNTCLREAEQIGYKRKALMSSLKREVVRAALTKYSASEITTQMIKTLGG